jgi:CRP-like cAMP-binding protein
MARRCAAAVTLFEGLSRKQLAHLARLSDDLDTPAGTVLCKEGSGGRHLATVGAGDFFGEIALIERVKRTATVTAVTPLRFFVISAQAFDSVLAADPVIERKVLRALARRVLSISGDPNLG